MRARIILALGVTAAALPACMIMDGERMPVEQKGSHAKAAAETTDAAVTVTTNGGDAQDPPKTTPDEAGAAPIVNVSVDCGGKTCQGATPFCCASSDTGTCVDAATTSCTGSRLLLRCDDPSDCAAGEVCCLFDERSATVCTKASDCVGDPTKVGKVCTDDSQCGGVACSDIIYDSVTDKQLNAKAGVCFAEGR